MASTGLVYQRRRRLERINEDILMKLPEEVLLHILSFLPMQDAVRTIVLSRRWGYIWTLLPNLTFELNSEDDRKFVDRTLVLRESTIHKFSLQCSIQPLDDLHLRRWVTALVRRLNVKDLHLTFSGFDFWRDSFQFPRCLFASASLTRLSLSMYWRLKVPKFVSLSSLKHLVLENAIFTHAKSLDRLFKGCPMLETARLLRCIFYSDFSISAPQLYELEIEENANLNYPYGCNVILSGPSLKSFHLDSEFRGSYCLNDLPSLVEAAVSVVNWSDEWERFLRCLDKLLKGISRVEKLCLSGSTIWALNHEWNRLPEVPLFNNLSILSFDGDMAIELDDNNIGLMKILQNSPCLETIRFERGIILPAQFKKCKGLLKPVPLCFMSCLKRLEILFDSDYEDQQLFTNAARILLKRAAVLEKLIVYLPNPNQFAIQFRGRVVDRPMVKEELIKALIDLPRASKLCQIEFVHSAMKSSR